MKNISFAGKAYFLDDVAKEITPARKARIEEYAKKLDKDTDVIVFGQQEEYVYEYNGKTYSQSQIGLNLVDEDFPYVLRDGNQTIQLDSDKVKTKSKKIPVFNAYIVHSYDKSSILSIPDKKQFDFRPDAKSTVIDEYGKLIRDIPY